jgi:antitoxin component of RelBE/YafQ-DinJ toxin-antitoxin module
VSDNVKKKTIAALNRKIPADVELLKELGLTIEDAIKMVKDAQS